MEEDGLTDFAWGSVEGGAQFGGSVGPGFELLARYGGL